MDNASVSIQKPKEASNFSTNPVAMESKTDESGFNYNYFNYSGIEPNKELTFEVAYKKSGSKPSVTKQQGLGNSVPQQNGGSGINPQNNSQLVLLLFLIGGIIFFSFGAMAYFSNNQKYGSKSRKKRSRYGPPKRKKRLRRGY